MDKTQSEDRVDEAFIIPQDERPAGIQDDRVRFAQEDNVADAQEDNVADSEEESDKSPFILLHGFAQTSRSWDEVARALRARGHEVYVPDLMNIEPPEDKLSRRGGRRARNREREEVLPATLQDANTNNVVDPQEVIALGQSMIKNAYAQLSSAQSMEDLCDATAVLVCAVACACQRPPILVGYSMGGRVALETLVSYGEVLPLCGLILESAGLGPRDQAERRAFSQRSKQWVSRLKTEGIEAFVDWWETLPLFDTQQSLPPEVREQVRAERIGCGADKLIRMTKGVEQNHQSYAEDSHAALNDACEHGLPVLYLAGALDDRYSAFADDLRTFSPQVEVHIVSQTGHNIHLERPNVFIAVLQAWADIASSKLKED